MSDLIYIYQNNQQEGPYSPAELCDMMADGILLPSTLAWKEGMSDWDSLEAVITSQITPITPVAQEQSLYDEITQQMDQQPDTQPESMMPAALPRQPRIGCAGSFLVGCAISAILLIIGMLIPETPISENSKMYESGRVMGFAHGFGDGQVAKERGLNKPSRESLFEQARLWSKRFSFESEEARDDWINGYVMQYSATWDHERYK